MFNNSCVKYLRYKTFFLNIQHIEVVLKVARLAKSMI